MRRYAVLIFFLVIATLANAESEVTEAYTRSYMYERVFDYNDAIKTLLIVYQKYPQGYTLNLRLGWLYYLLGNYANALSHYQDAIRIAPGALDAKMGQTLPLLAQKRWLDVEQILYQILQTDYYNYYANLRLVYVLRMQEKYELAEAVGKKMLVLYPIDLSFLTELALVKQAQQDKDSALKIYQDILILDPENYFARTYLQQNDVSKKPKAED